MYLGCAWYPEHWDESRWPVDLELMRSAGMNVVRMGEYAWCRLEPAEGRFELDWLERAINMAGRHGIAIVLGTPTDAPPAWLTQKYPEVLRIDENGRPVAHGGRRHFSQFHPRYRQLCAAVVTELAQRFGRHPNVLGWQIGNEFCMYSHNPLTHRLFQQWLAARYQTLPNLNRHWTTAYWSQEYTDWSQIPLPTGWPHPGMQLDFFRFQSEGFADFQRDQIRIIRAHAAASQWITHNIHCWEDLDFTAIIDDCELASWDPYPGGSSTDHRHFGWYSDLCRTLKPRPHWIMETQPGHVNWAPPNATMPRGAVRALAWHFYAHGAQAVLFWQWRAALSGQEQLHGAVIANDGTPRPLYAEIAQVGREIRDLAPTLADTHTPTDVALLYSYADQYALKHQKHHPEFDGLKHFGEFYAALRSHATDVDVIDPRRISARYRLIIAPHLYLLDDALAQQLARYIHAGGHVLLGPRSGFKDQYNAMLPSRQPGEILGALLGAQVEDFCTLQHDIPLSGSLGEGRARIWAEYLRPQAPDTQVLLRYGACNGWVDTQPAAVSRQVGHGRITYLGTLPDTELMKRLIGWTMKLADVPAPLLHVPDEVEVCRRIGPAGDIMFLINHSASPARVRLPSAVKDLLTGQQFGRALVLEPFAVAILGPSKSKTGTRSPRLGGHRHTPAAIQGGGK